ncbi:hypothetical protein LTR85_005329 [Meristemomyces frigidus]|nr:hypothetical protein LTR85_005329 [Meristemomyces frigidus]
MRACIGVVRLWTDFRIGIDYAQEEMLYKQKVLDDLNMVIAGQGLGPKVILEVRFDGEWTSQAQGKASFEMLE